MRPRRLSHNGSRRLGNSKDTRNRLAMRATGCGTTKTCLPQNKNASYRKIPRSAACRPASSKCFDNGCSISQTCPRNSSCAC